MQIYGDVDLQGNQLNNLVIQQLETTPTNPKNFQIYGDGQSNALKIYLNGAWRSLDFGMYHKLFVLDFDAGATTSIFSLPINASIVSIKVVVTVGFDFPSTMSIGVTGDTQKYISTTDTDLTSIGVYDLTLANNIATVDESIILTYTRMSATIGVAHIHINYLL